LAYHRSISNLKYYKRKVYADRIAKKKTENLELIKSGAKEKDTEVIQNHEMPRVVSTKIINKTSRKLIITLF
jgi:hypothetical protein